MRILLVTRGFPPKGRWGSEGYSHDLAKALVGRGVEVAVFYPAAGEQGVETWTDPDGILVQEAAFPRPQGKPFRASYRDARQDRALAAFFAEHGRFDRVHFTALAGEVSMGLLPIARAHADEVLVTLTELLPYCHRGQLLDAELKPCTGPEPRKCSACVMASSPWARPGGSAAFKAGLVRALSFTGRLLPLPTPAAFTERERFVQECFQSVDLFLAPSEGLRDRYVQLGMPKERIRYLPYALDPERYRDYRRAELPEIGKRGPLRLAYMGQLAPHKGVQILVDAMGHLDATLREQLHMTLYGSATAVHHPLFWPALEARIAHAGLPIDIPGPFPPDEVARILSQVDIVLLPSLWIENLPLVLMHARACGLPILASDVAGIATFIDDGQDGWLVPAGDVAAWTHRLEQLALARREGPASTEATQELAHVQQGARQCGNPMDLSEHLDWILALDRLRALPDTR